MSSTPDNPKRDGRMHRAGPGRAGFTLLETMLAAVLGSLVIIASFSLFSVVDRSDKRTRTKMDEAIELASARATIARAFHLLLMSDEQPPTETEVEEFLKEDELRNADDRADLVDEDAASTRLALQPDPDTSVRMIIGAGDRQRTARVQTFRVTLRDSPTLGEGEQTEEEKLLAQIRRERIIARAMERTSRRGSGSSSARSSSDSSLEAALDIAADAARGRDSASGRRGARSERGEMDSGRGGDGRRLSLRPPRDDRSRSGSRNRDRDRRRDDDDDLGEDDRDRDELTASERLLEEEEEQPRARGVRGLFEVLPDDTRPQADDGAPLFALWWRELPPVEVDSEFDSGDDIDAAITRLANAGESGKRVRLLSGLRTCHWTAFRGRTERDKITAKFYNHLPAYVELEIITASGRRENWVFDVAWTTGPEPGTPIAPAADPLNNAPVSGDQIDGGGDADDGSPTNPGTPGRPTTNPNTGGKGGKGGGKGGKGGGKETGKGGKDGGGQKVENKRDPSSGKGGGGGKR